MSPHLALWADRVPWGSEVDTKDVVELGDEIMKRADGEDWE